MKSYSLEPLKGITSAAVLTFFYRGMKVAEVVTWGQIGTFR